MSSSSHADAGHLVNKHLSSPQVTSSNLQHHLNPSTSRGIRCDCPHGSLRKRALLAQCHAALSLKNIRECPFRSENLRGRSIRDPRNSKHRRSPMLTMCVKARSGSEMKSESASSRFPAPLLIRSRRLRFPLAGVFPLQTGPTE